MGDLDPSLIFSLHVQMVLWVLVNEPVGALRAALSCMAPRLCLASMPWCQDGYIVVDPIQGPWGASEMQTNETWLYAPKKKSLKTQRLMGWELWGRNSRRPPRHPGFSLHLVCGACVCEFPQILSNPSPSWHSSPKLAACCPRRHTPLSDFQDPPKYGPLLCVPNLPTISPCRLPLSTPSLAQLLPHPWLCYC